MIQNISLHNSLHRKSLYIFVSNLYSLFKNSFLVHSHYYLNFMPQFCMYSESHSIQGYFYNANLSRIVPSDFEQDIQTRIERLLFRASFSDFSHDAVINYPNTLSALDIFKHDSHDMESPVFNLLSLSDLILARKMSLDNIKLLFQIPKILNPRKSLSFNSDKSGNTRIGSLLCYDAYPHSFLNISRVENKSPKIINQLEIEEFIETINKSCSMYPILLYREIDGELRLAKWQEIDRIIQAFFSPMWSNGIPKMLVSQNKLYSHPHPPQDYFEDAKDGNFEIMLDSHLHLYLLEIIIQHLTMDSEEYIHLHYSICRHILNSGNISLLKNTRHFGGLLWWVIIGEMEDVQGLESVFNWCSNFKESTISQCVNELIDIVSQSVICNLNKKVFSTSDQL